MQKARVIKTYRLGPYSKTIGKIGTVVSRCQTPNLGWAVSLSFDHVKNPHGRDGVFYYREDEIEFIDTEEETKMKLEPGYKIARVVFLDGFNTSKEYSFAIYEDVEIDALVVVESNYKVAKVCNILTVEEAKEQDIVMPTKQVVAVVNDKAYKERQEKAKRRVELKKEMDKKVEAIKEEQLYAMFAKEDPALAALLAEYRSL